MAFYQCRIPRCQHIKTNGTQCGSPALRNDQYCYFHSRWRATHVDLSQSAHHVSSTFDLPVLEDADSIQVALGQIMRMIVCRQVDTKSAGLLLYGLQIASANLRRTRFEPYHRDVMVDLDRVTETTIGDEAWSPADFANVGHVGRTCPEPQAKAARVGRAPSPAKPPSSAKESLAEPPSPAKESSPKKKSHVAKPPFPAKEPCAAPTLPESQPKAPSSPPRDLSSPAVLSASDKRELKQLKKVHSALDGAQAGDWRDLKAVFELTGIFPPKANAPAKDP